MVLWELATGEYPRRGFVTLPPELVGTPDCPEVSVHHVPVLLVLSLHPLRQNMYCAVVARTDHGPLAVCEVHG